MFEVICRKLNIKKKVDKKVDEIVEYKTEEINGLKIIV